MSSIGDFQLPDGWELLSLDCLGKAITGNTPPTKNPENYGGDIPFIKPTELVNRPVSMARETISAIGAEKSRILPKGGVLVSCIGNLGKTGIAKRDVAFNQQINAVVFNEIVVPEYGFYYFQTLKFRHSLESLASATTISIVNKSKFESIKVPIAPIEQQKHIVAKIEELFPHIDAGIASLQAAKKLLKQYRQSVLKAAVTGELTKDWRKANKDKLEPASQLLERILKERRQCWEEQQLEKFEAKGKMPKDDKWKEKYKEPKVVTVDGLPLLPEEWVWASLPQIGELNRGKSKHRPRNDPSLYGGDYPFVQTGDIRAANTWLKEYSQTYSDKGLAQSRLWPIGTMCITIAANIADTAILDFNGCFPDSVVGFIPLNDSVNIEVIEFFFRTVKSDLEKYAPATAQKNINLAILETVAIPLLPLEEQIELINNLKYKISMADRLEEEIDRQLIKTEKSKQSVLASAFSGILIGAAA